MRTRCAPVVLLACSLLALSPSLVAGPRSSGQSGSAANATAAPSARIWEGRASEFEEFLRTAEIDRFDSVPLGVTHPKRAFFKPGGLVASAAWKVLPPGRPAGYWESYKSEIAAYELDKLLDLRMVPVTVEKRWKGETAAAVLWLAPIHPWKEMESRPKPAKWVYQVARMKMFDNFICNKDRNAGNLLVDDDWNLYLIDHSRAFLNDRDLAVKMEHIDRGFWNRILALDEPALTAAIGKWVEGGAIRAMLARRDKMKIAIDKLVAASSESAVFLK
jgi:hypothetical protein